MGDYLKVTQVRSEIGRMEYQRQTLRGLGIKKRGRTAYVEDTPSTRGMVAAVGHLVVCEEATKAERDAAVAFKRPPSYVVVEDEPAAKAPPVPVPEAESTTDDDEGGDDA